MSYFGHEFVMGAQGGLGLGWHSQQLFRSCRSHGSYEAVLSFRKVDDLAKRLVT